MVEKKEILEILSGYDLENITIATFVHTAAFRFLTVQEKRE